MTNEAFSGIPAPLVTALVERGFSSLTPVQRAVVDADAEGRDLRISSQTGSGKTVAIGLALASRFLRDLETSTAQASESASASPESCVETSALPSGPAAQPSGPLRPKRPTGPKGPAAGRGSAARPTALVIVPTRELAAQVSEELAWLYAHLRGFSVEVVTGGTSILMERRALARAPKLIVGTPGRLLDHIRNAAVVCDQIEHVVLDEADQMLDMGFREELEAILEQLPESRSSHLVSATFHRNVLALANQYQRNALSLEGTKLGVANADIQHIAYPIRRHETYAALVNTLLLAGDSRCLLFVNRRVDATDLAEKLSRDGFGAAPFSGELPQAQRTRTLAAFRSGTLPILVSTDVAARGIDVPDISTVIHVDPPRNPDAYVHRSGRTGRAGQTGRSILLIVGPETRRVKRMLQGARIEVSWQPVPQPEKVQKALLKQARRKLHERIAEEVPSEAQLAYAAKLLEDRDPATIVATLLEMAKPKPACEPMKIVGLDPFAETRPGRKGARGADFEATSEGRRDATGGHAGRQDRSGPRGGERSNPVSYTRFSISWGEQTGATTGRVLSHVCRRGGLESHHVGAIKVNSKSTVIDIASDIADAFESRARRPDKREPGILIRRLGAHEAGASESGPKRGPKSGPKSAFKHGYTKPGHHPGHASGGSTPPSGPARDARGPKRPGRPASVGRKPPHRRASR